MPQKTDLREVEDEEISVFESAFQWITSPKNKEHKEEPIIVEENKKKSFGRNRSKKISDDTNVCEITMNSAFTSGSKEKYRERAWQ